MYTYGRGYQRRLNLDTTATATTSSTYPNRTLASTIKLSIKCTLLLITLYFCLIASFLNFKIIYLYYKGHKKSKTSIKNFSKLILLLTVANTWSILVSLPLFLNENTDFSKWYLGQVIEKVLDFLQGIFERSLNLTAGSRSGSV